MFVFTILLLIAIPTMSDAFGHSNSWTWDGVGFPSYVPDWYIEIRHMYDVTLAGLFVLVGGICYCVIRSIIKYREMDLQVLYIRTLFVW